MSALLPLCNSTTAIRKIQTMMCTMVIRIVMNSAFVFGRDGAPHSVT
jgi:hypothetical protein